MPNLAEHEHLEAAVFRRLVQHLQAHTDVQNIDIMNLAGFCRNCLSKCYEEEAETQDIDVTIEDAKTMIYGMDYGEWKEKYQK